MTPPKLTKGMKDALAAIASGHGQFHKIVANRLANAGLAVAGSLTLTVYSPNGRGWFVDRPFTFASDWLLTEAGAAAIEMEPR